MNKKRRSWGGYRRNAGRRPGSYKYGEPTAIRRLPKSWLTGIDQALAAAQQARRSAEIEDVQPAVANKPMALPLAGSRVAAGFPSPAEDFVEGQLDLNDYLIRHPAATFYVRVSGESMLEAGIFPGDILVVDRAENPRHGDVVIAVLDGELTVKRLYTRDGVIRLVAENAAYADIEIADYSELTVWGVVRACVHQFRS